MSLRLSYIIGGKKIGASVLRECVTCHKEIWILNKAIERLKESRGDDSYRPICTVCWSALKDELFKGKQIIEVDNKFAG